MLFGIVNDRTALHVRRVGVTSDMNRCRGSMDIGIAATERSDGSRIGSLAAAVRVALVAHALQFRVRANETGRAARHIDR